MNRWLTLRLALLVALTAPTAALAQQPSGQTPPATPPIGAPATPVEEAPADEEGAEGEEEPAQDEAPQETPPDGFEPLPPVEDTTPPPPSSDGFAPLDASESPISGLGAKPGASFQPLQDIEEEELDPIYPALLYPTITWHGMFRTRSTAAINFDLGTGGTSAILPPAERYTPLTSPANADADTLWSTDMRLRLAPQLMIMEGLSVYVEADLMNNVGFGTQLINRLPSNPLTPDPSRNVYASGQYSPREREWFSNAVQINEVYGEISGFFGTVRAGRMDNHWGLGMFFNDGDCLDCDFGDQIDRVMFQTQAFGISGMAAVDFPSEGVSSVNPGMPYGQPYDLAQIDDIDQFTLALEYAPKTRAARERERKKLREDRAPVLNAGLMFTWRRQEGSFADTAPGQPFDPTQPPQLIWQGLSAQMLDGWAELRYEPSAKRRMRLGLEVATIFGTQGNASGQPVGQTTVDGNTTQVNCFDENTRNANEASCLVAQREYRQLAVALESEFYVGGPVVFGFNGGYASGGDAQAWGWNAPNGADLDFFRFDPNYHVDLIMFRRVIGTVTNAYYFKPYVQASFLDTGARKVRLDLEGILSRAADPAGAPSGVDPWLGFEMDAAVRYIIQDTFHAGVEGGILFPFAGLSARQDREAVTQLGTSTGTFAQDIEASTAWTVQLKLNWMF